MSIFDIALLVILAGFVWSGLTQGLIRLIGNLVGLVVGAYLASHYYLAFYQWSLQFGWIKTWALAHEGAAQVIAFIILLVVVAKLVGLLAVILEQVFKFIAIIPGSKYLNNLLGAVLGFLEGALFLGLIIYVLSRYTLVSNFFGTQLTGSVVAPVLLKIVTIIMPFLPQALKTLKAVI
jgi:membrane protein required for colicin V production